MRRHYPTLTCPTCRKSGDNIVGKREVGGLWYEVLCFDCSGHGWQKAVESEPISLDEMEALMKTAARSLGQ